MARRILFVCTGNICRSPLAEYVARSIFQDQDLTFQSVGTHAIRRLRATPDMIAVGDGLGVDLRKHRSRSIKDVSAPDVILCMEQHHVDPARRRFPDMAEGSIRLLDTGPVADPYGMDRATYEACGNQIAQAVANLTF